ncbi:hypothetical protein F5B22DRAFT_652429 [Xylaria bambusicola]|uniref:uncharacterized protein n=1 Tax=Xylaria bambusicola TaxID=326684 RepID=UPI0020071F8D|nr:uncharacterized protein F5B22DRAFT_652429 [Xylaria bambusicola]KAI0503070.1 hypothetical protein F5B22DRAFT_652429 [Xylaria bambusicola]
MQSNILLFITALAGTTVAQRSDAAYCVSKMSSFLSWANTEGPTTPVAVLDFLAHQTNSKPPLATFGPEAHGEEICSIYRELPASILPEFQTYIVSVLSFGSVNSDVLIGVATECAPEDQVASITSYIHEMLTPTGLCEETPTPTPTPCGMANGTYPTSVYSPTPTATGSYPTSIVTAGAAKPTGALLGAAAVGGLLGAAALL